MENGGEVKIIAQGRELYQRDVLEAIEKQSTISEVLAALQRMQPFLPGPSQAPIYKTHFSLGANLNS